MTLSFPFTGSSSLSVFSRGVLYRYMLITYSAWAISEFLGPVWWTIAGNFLFFGYLFHLQVICSFVKILLFPAMIIRVNFVFCREYLKIPFPRRHGAAERANGSGGIGILCWLMQNVLSNFLFDIRWMIYHLCRICTEWFCCTFHIYLSTLD